jgi:chromosome segregation ATPase
MQNDRDIHTMLTRKDSWLNQMAVKHQVDPAAAGHQKQLASLQKRLAGLEKAKSRIADREDSKQLKRLDQQINSLKKKMRPLENKLAAAQTSKTDMDIQAVITEAYLRTLSRFPRPDEISRCESHIREDQNLINGVTGVLWALVNTKEFIVNH